MGILAVWTRIELRRRRRALAVLALLVALASGTVLAAAAGARRGATAVDRLLAVTLPATAVVSPNRAFFDWAAVRRLPDVESVATLAVYTGFGVDEAPGATAALGVPIDAEMMRTIERPVVLDGRLADPARADEAVVTPAFAATHGLGVGATATVRLFTPAQVDTGVSALSTVTPPRPDGPAVPVRIVGVVRSPWLAGGADTAARLFPSPGLVERYRASFLGAAGDGALNALVRLRDGAAGLPAFRAELATAFPAGPADPAIDVADRSAAVARIRDATTFQVGFLLAFGVAALVASVVLVGLAVTRYAAASAADLAALGAVGMTRWQRVACAAAGPGLAAVAGAGLGTGVAVAASAWLPFGTAATVEPAPGVDVDAAVLGPGALLAVVAVVAAAAVGALRAASGVRRPRAARPSSAARFASAAGLAVPVLVGTRFAVETDREPGAVAVRPALAGAVTGVLGVMAALTFAAGVADAAGHPERFGQTYELDLGIGYSYNGMASHQEQVQRVVAADPDITALADTRFAVADAGAATVLAFAGPDGGPAPPPLTLTAGRLPAAGEVALAPATARLLGAGIGDEVRLSRDAQAVTLHVVGSVLLPQTPYNDYDAGAWLDPGDYDRLFGSFFLNRPGLATLRPGADPAAVAARLEKAVAAATAGRADILGPDVAPVPSRLADIAALRGLTLVLGGFLALVAVGAVGHALVTSVRRRRRDLAVLRALGMTPRQAGAVVVTQASVLAAVGLLFGVPLGVALGRVLWGVVADLTPLAYRPPVAAAALLLVVPVALVVANALAVWPGRRAARLGVATVLRVE